MSIVSKHTSGGDSEKCDWCSAEVHLPDLTGGGSNQCPHCGTPMMKAEFQNLSEGIVFCCKNGGKWAKYATAMAVCVEDDSAFYVGEQQEFEPADVVYPY